MLLILSGCALLGAAVILLGLPQETPRLFAVFLLLFPLAALACWLLLLELRVGQQSLANLVEVPLVILLAALLAIAAGRASVQWSWLESTPGMMLVSFLLVLSVVLVRLLMPELPE